AGLHRLVAAQPLGPDPGAALPPRQGRGHPGRDPLPRSGLQSLPGVRGAAARRARGDRAGVRAARPDGDQPVHADEAGAARARDRVAARVARRGDRPGRGVAGGREGARLRAARPPDRAQARGVGRVPRAGQRVGAPALPADALARPVWGRAPGRGPGPMPATTLGLMSTTSDRATRHVELLTDTVAAVSSSLDLAEVLERIASRVA